MTFLLFSTRVRSRWVASFLLLLWACPSEDLEVNKANEVRCFGMTHANVSVKPVHRDIFHPPPPPTLHRGVESSFSSRRLCSHGAKKITKNSQMWCMSNITCSVPGRLTYRIGGGTHCLLAVERHRFWHGKNRKLSLKGLLTWPCRIMKDVTGSAHFSLVIWLTPRGLQEIYYILLFPADFKAQTMFGKVAWLFHHVLPCGPSWYFLRSQFFCQQGKAGGFFITLFNFLVMATRAAWCIFH